jgi:hypothetical protein
MVGSALGERRRYGGWVLATRRTIVWVSASAAVAVLLSLVGAGTAFGKGRLSKGFPYAAEISATVTYDATFTQDAVDDDPCGDADGNTVDQQVTSHEQEHLDRTVQFKHITVPVVPEWTLGAAARRLALKPTITDPGTVRSDGSTYDLSGNLIGQDTCPGTKTPYDCPGTITNVGQLDSVLISGGEGFDPEIDEIPIFSGQIADPVTCPPIDDNEIPTLLGIDAAQAHPGWASVILHTGLSPRFYALRTKPQLAWSVPVNGAAPCPDSGQLSCTQTVTGVAHIAIKRLFLYRTKRSYAK